MQQAGCTWPRHRRQHGTDGLWIRTGGGMLVPGCPRNSPGMFCHPCLGSPFGVMAGAPLTLRHWGTLGWLLPGLQLLTAEQGSTGSLGLDTPGGAG